MEKLALVIASIVLAIAPGVADDRPPKDQPSSQRIDWD